MKIPNELFTTFNAVQYFDEPHKYILNGKELISVTTLIHRYEDEFDEEYWSAFKGKQFGINPRIIKRAWRFINKKGTIKGSAIHDYAENLFLNKDFGYPKQLILNEFGFDPIWSEYQTTKNHVDRFYNDVRGKLIPVKTELILFDEEAMLGGMLDMLFYNVKAKEFQIWDWKTNKKFSMDNKNAKGEKFLKNKLSILENCDLEIYSLQLEMYKQIIERNTSIKLGKSYIVWFSHNNENYKVIETKERKYFIDVMLQERILELAA